VPRSLQAKILVIPDLHCRHHRIEEIIDQVRPLRTVFLGDTFDQFGDSPSENADAAKWLRHSIHQSDRVHLIGNHDLPYCFDYNWLQIKQHGWTREKFKAINRVMKSVDWAMLQVFHIQRPYLFSHAGLQASYVNPMIDLSDLPDWVRQEETDFWSRLYHNEHHWFLNRGKARGGDHAFGGPLWADWKEMVVMPGWHQVFGHTPNQVIRTEGDEEGSITCIDTVSRDSEYPSYVGIVNAHGYHQRRTVDVLAGVEYP